MAARAGTGVSRLTRAMRVATAKVAPSTQGRVTGLAARERALGEKGHDAPRDDQEDQQGQVEHEA